MVPLISTICITRFIYTFSISLFMFLEIHIFAPDGRRPRRAAKGQDIAIRIARNGRPPTTLPEPIKRARDQDLRGFAGEGNVAERSERMRAKRSPTSPRIKSEERGWAC